MCQTFLLRERESGGELGQLRKEGSAAGVELKVLSGGIGTV